MLESIRNFLHGTGIVKLFAADNWWQTLIMFVIVGVLVYLAIVKQYEPLLLLPIAIGMLLTNLPGANIFHPEFFIGETNEAFSELFPRVLDEGGLIDLLYLGVKLGIYPCLIFIGIGAMTDFSPLIANPKSLLIGAGAQLGVFAAFAFALLSGLFTPEEAASIGIIGGADGPTAIRGVQLYGAHSAYPTAFYAASHHEKGARDPYDHAPQGNESGKDLLSRARHVDRRSHCAGRRAACRLSDVR